MFCQKCGTQLPDGSSFCVSCGAATVSVVDYSQITAQPSAFGSYMGKVMRYIGGLFKSPSKNIQTLASEKSPVWATLGAVKYILSLITILLMTLAAEQDWVGAMNLCNLISDSILCDNFGMKLLFSMILFAGTFGIHWLMTWVSAVHITKLQVPATVLLNICSVCSFPLIPAMVLAIVASFIWFPLALVILIVGAVMCGVMYTEAVRASGIFGSETVWKNVLVLCATFAVFSLLLSWALSGI